LLFIFLSFLSKGKAPSGRGSLSSSLEFDYINRFEAFRSLFGIKADTVTFGQALKAISLDARMMDKNIIAVFTGDEAKPFTVVEPLYSSLFHAGYLLISRLKSQKDSIKKTTKLKVSVAFYERKNF
jgi:hypothetical protein